MNPRELLEGLVRVPSVSGDEAAAVAWLVEAATGLGLEAWADDAGNFHAKTPAEGEPVWFIGHIDTVPGHIDVRVEGDILHGRGSGDAKGPLACAVAAAARCPDVPFRVIGTIEEELTSRGARALGRIEGSACIFGEPSGWDGITLGWKGIVRAKIIHKAPCVHGGHPEPNAIDAFVRDWNALGLHEGFGFEQLGLRIKSIRSENDGLHDTVIALTENRVPPGRTTKELIDALRAQWPETEVVEAWEPATSDPRNELATRFRAAIRARGGEPRMLHKTGTSDWNAILDQMGDMPVVTYGPGDSQYDHTPHERIDLRDLDRAVEAFVDVLQGYQKGS